MIAQRRRAQEFNLELFRRHRLARGGRPPGWLATNTASGRRPAFAWKSEGSRDIGRQRHPRDGAATISHYVF
jgi:hypothetical protein